MTGDFIFGLVIGCFVGTVVGFFAAACMKVAKQSDEDSDYLGEQIARGDVRL